MGQNMVSWICEKQGVHEVTHFCDRSYLKRADCADESVGRGNEAGLTAHAMDAGKRSLVRATRGDLSGVEGDRTVGWRGTTSGVGLSSGSLGKAGARGPGAS